MVWLCVILGGILLFGVMALMGGRHQKEWRERHLAGHPGVPEEAFLLEAGVPKQLGEVALGIRRGVARALGVASETLYASDSMATLAECGFDGMDLIEFTLDIEKEMGVKLSSRGIDEVWNRKKNLKEMALGEFVRCLTENWEMLVVRAGK